MAVDKLKLVNNLYSVVNTYTYPSNSPLIADKGASGHYLKANAPHDLASRPVAPVQVKEQNVQILQSTKGCLTDISNLIRGVQRSTHHTSIIT